MTEEEETSSRRKTKQTIQVVYAGHVRSGTRSLKAALTLLGYKACHGYDIGGGSVGDHREVVEALSGQDVPALVKHTEALDYNATLDMHSIFWKEILQERPYAKIIAVVRPYYKWEKSVRTLYFMMKPIYRYPLRFIPAVDAIASMSAALASYGYNISLEEAWSVLQNPESQAEKVQKESFEKYINGVMEFAKEKPEKVLLFQLKDGYAPLCEFLEVSDCPKGAFPWVNSGYELQMTGYVLRGLEAVLYSVPILVAFLGWKIIVRVHRRTKTKNE